MNNTTFVLPASFTYVFNITGVDVGDGAWSIGLGYVNSYTAHFWTKSSAPVSFYFVAVGYQQWGLTGNDPGDGGASAQLSIPITALIFGQARTTSSEVLSSVFSVDVDNTSTLCIDSSNIQYKGGYAYLIGCKQQWGYVHQSGNDNQTLNLPIAFNFSAYSVAIATYNSGNHASCKGFTQSTITLNAGEDPNVVDRIGYFILGIQSSGVFYQLILIILLSLFHLKIQIMYS